jgi:transcription factor TFIIIB component B''
MAATAEAKKYGRANGEEQTSGPSAALASALGTGSGPTSVPEGEARNVDRASSEDVDDGDKEDGHGFDYSAVLDTNRFTVQVRLGANGETIIDEESLFVQRDDNGEEQEYTQIEESDTTKFVNSGSYGKKVRGSRWSAEETELFYDVGASTVIATGTWSDAADFC